MLNVLSHKYKKRSDWLRADGDNMYLTVPGLVVEPLQVLRVH